MRAITVKKLLTLLVSLSIFLSLIPAMVSAQTNGPVAAWSFNENGGTSSTDATGNGNTASFVGAPVWATGKNGGGISFNRTSTLNAGSGAVLDDLAPTTISFWLNPRTLDSSTDIFLGKPNSFTTGATVIHVDSALNRRIGFFDDWSGGDVMASFDQTLTLNAWQYIAITWNGQSNSAGTDVKLYVDGVEKAATSFSSGGSDIYSNATANLIIGPFDGTIDDLRIYNRVLSQQEIQSDMNAPVGSTSTPSPPPTTDTTPPSVPVNLSAIAVSSSQINLSWSASIDNVGVTGYNVYRGGIPIATVAGLSYNDTGLSANTAYSYNVVAIDAAGNPSAQSGSASVTTQGTTSPPSSNVIATIASSMVAGEWREVPQGSSFGGGSILVPRGGDGNILEFMDEAQRNPMTKKIYIIGCARATSGSGAYQCSSTTAEDAKFIVYDETTNSWSEMPSVPVNSGPHSYDHAAIDPNNGDYYYRENHNNTIWRNTGGEWIKLPPTPVLGNEPGANAAEFFPELGGLVVPNPRNNGGEMYLYTPSTNSWSILPDDFAGNYSQFTEYNPIHKFLYFGGGIDFDKNLYKLDANKKVTRLADSPVTLGTGSGCAAVQTIDPLTGNLIVFSCDQGRNSASSGTYEYNPTTNSWRKTGSHQLVYNDLMAAAVPLFDYGVTFVGVKIGGGISKVYLYKHSTGSTPPPSTPAPTVSLGASPASVTSGNSSTLSWSSTNATSCTASGAWSGTKPTGGSQSITNITTTSTYILSCTGSGGTANQSVTVSVTSTTPPPATTQVITGITFDWSTHKSLASGSDNWPITWADDDHQYTSWGDGGGFGGSRVSLGVARITGPYESLTGTNLWTGDGKSYGILSVGGILYLWVSPGSDSTNYTEARIYQSTNHGVSWTSASWAFTKTDGLILPTFLQAGKDYSSAQDGYVYVYANHYKGASSLAVQKPGEIALLRVPRTAIMDRTQYQFFAGLDANGNPTWTTTLSARKPVFTDANGVGWATGGVIYNTGLNRYVLATEYGTTGQGNLGIFEAPKPWGPWNTVYYGSTPNSAFSQAFVTNFSAKWMSMDGKSFVMIFSGTEDTWNSVRGTFTISSFPPSSTKFSLNDRIQVSSGPLNVRATASANGTLLGSQATNSLGTVIGGPITADGFTWWNIDYDNAPDGWSAENFLVKYTAPTPAPTVSLGASPASVTSGNSSTLSWSSTNATSCTASGAWSGTKPTGGSQSITNITTTSTYILSCTGSGGTANQSVTVSVTSTTPPPATSVVGGYPMPTLEDERNTYRNWGWTWSPNVEPAAVTEPTANYYVTLDPNEVRYDTEADDLWNYLMMYRRTGNTVYLNRAQAWLRYFKDEYRGDLIAGDNFSHLYGWGLLAWYEHTCAQGVCDTAALSAAEAIGAEVETYWSNAIPGSFVMGQYGPRKGARSLTLATRLAEVTKNQRWVLLRDKLIELWIKSPDWDARGMYFSGKEETDNETGLGVGSYDAGYRVLSSFQVGLLADAFYHAYRVTGRTDLRDKLLSMASFVNQYGLDPVTQYTGSYFGVAPNGNPWHKFEASAYTTSLVDALVIRYKLTGDSSYLNRAKYFFNRGTKGVYGNPNTRTASDTQVDHFVDTVFSSDKFYLSYNKGELQYTYMIFENGGNPSVVNTTTPPPPPSPDTSVPTTPTNLSATAVSSSQINLSWTASTDNVGVMGYRIYRGGTLLTTVAATSYSNTGLAASTAYSYAVEAIDAANNVSALSAPASATTQPLSSATFTTGDRVQVSSGPLNVRATASASGTLLGSQATNNLGTVIGGPTIADGFTWWNVNYDTGVDGWSVETYLAKYTPPPPPTGAVGGYLMPTLQDERTTYTSWGWTWSPNVEPAAVTEPIANYYVTLTPDEVRYDTEGDDLWTYLMMYRRSGNPVYLNRAQAWLRYFKVEYRDDLVAGDVFAHLYGVGLIAWYEHTCAQGLCDDPALAAAEGIGVEVEKYWQSAVAGQYYMSTYGARKGSRNLMFATRLAEVTKNQRWITLRDKLIDLWMKSPDWDVRGMYFTGYEFTNSVVGAGAYAAGYRTEAPYQVALLSEALYQAYRVTGRTDIRGRLLEIIKFVDKYGMDPNTQYSGSFFGLAPDGSVWHKFESSAYSTSLVNTLVMGYKFTGNPTYLSRAKYFFNRGTKGVYGDPNKRTAPDDVVHHFVDTVFSSGGGYFDLSYNKGELQYTYMIFENGGNPSVVNTTTPPPPPSPDTSVPTTPTNLSATAVSTSQINLSWSASTDPLVAGQTTSGISGYRIYRSGTQIATSPTTSYSNTGLTSGTTYSYTVAAVDGATPANVSPQSPSSSATTQSVVTVDTTSPTVSLTAPGANTTVSGTITISATASDNIGIAGVQFKLDNVNLGAEDTTSPYSTSWNTTSATNGFHTILAVARDAAGNRATSTGATIVVSNITSDTTNPTVTITTPTTLTTYTAPTGTVILGGTATDNIGVTQVSWSNSAGGTGTMTSTASWSTTLTLQSGLNTITVTGRDAAENTSTDIIAITYTPIIIDTQIPTPPASLTGTPLSASQISLMWSSSTDNTAVTGYKVFANGTQIATTTATTYTHTNLSPFTTYAYTISAYDAAGNTSALSSPLSVTTQAQVTISPPLSSGTTGGTTSGSGGTTTSGTPSTGGTTSAPPPASGLTNAQIQAILSLLSSFGADSATIARISAILTGTTIPTTTTTSTSFQTNLYFGIKSGDVTKLQQLLAQDHSVYPEGLVTGYYGSLTVKAVGRFQAKYGIVSSGTAVTTGYGVVGPKTRAKLNELVDSIGSPQGAGR